MTLQVEVIGSAHTHAHAHTHTRTGTHTRTRTHTHTCTRTHTFWGVYVRFSMGFTSLNDFVERSLLHCRYFTELWEGKERIRFGQYHRSYQSLPLPSGTLGLDGHLAGAQGRLWVRLGAATSEPGEGRARAWSQGIKFKTIKDIVSAKQTSGDRLPRTLYVGPWRVFTTQKGIFFF